MLQIFPVTSFSHFVTGVVLLALSVTVGAADNDGKDFREAAIIGDDETIIRMLDEGRVTVDNANQFGKTALMFAVEEDNFGVVSLLLNRGAEVNKVTVAGCTALTYAAEKRACRNNGYVAGAGCVS